MPLVEQLHFRLGVNLNQHCEQDRCSCGGRYYRPDRSFGSRRSDKAAAEEAAAAVVVVEAVEEEVQVGSVENLDEQRCCSCCSVGGVAAG